MSFWSYWEGMNKGVGVQVGRCSGAEVVRCSGLVVNWTTFGKYCACEKIFLYYHFIFDFVLFKK